MERQREKTKICNCLCLGEYLRHRWDCCCHHHCWMSLFLPKNSFYFSQQSRNFVRFFQFSFRINEQIRIRRANWWEKILHKQREREKDLSAFQFRTHTVEASPEKREKNPQCAKCEIWKPKSFSDWKNKKNKSGKRVCRRSPHRNCWWYECWKHCEWGMR